MSIKKIETFLWGMLLCFCSCVDDTYDMSKKDISLDMKIEGNCIALPLGNLRPIVLDSVLDLSTISMLKEDSISHVYSIAFNDSVKTRVARKDLSVLKEVSKLSSDIEPVAIGLDEIRFRFPTFEHSDSMSFQDVELSDVSLDAIHEEVELSLGNIKLTPISIAKDSREVNFEIPVVEVDDVYIDEYVESVSFSINDVEAGGQTDGVDKTFEFEVDDISINEISTPKFESYLSTLLSTTEVDVFLAGKGDDFELTSDLDAQFNIHKSDETQVDIKFEYTLPEEVKHLNRVELAHSDANRKGALVEFNVKNPKLLEGLSRSIDFRITFPKNYKLELYDNTYSSLTEDNEIRVVDMPADGDSTFVRFYLKEIGNLNDNKYYNGENGRTLELNDVASCEIDYSVLGRKIFPQGITVAEIKEGITYSVDLKVAFDVEEAHGSTNPIENSFESEEINLPISINNLEYINYIDKVVLDPSVSQLHFTTSINNDFGQFNLDADSKIIVSFPSEYVFSDNITLPTDVKRVDGTNDFEVSSMSVFNNTEWILPIREVKVQSEVVDGVLDLETKAIVRAVSSGKDEVLTIGAVDNVPLKKTANELSGKRNITLSVSPIEMSVIDVQGRINPIGIDFQSRIFNELDFEINDLDHVKAVEYIEFDSEQKIYITSSSDKEFSNMKLEEGSCIALRFPEDIFVFDQQHSTLPYDNKLKAFVINDLAQLKSGNWSLALKRININKEIVDKTLSLNFMVSLEAINSRGESDKLYVVSDGNFSLDKMRKQHLFGLHNIEFTVEGPAEGISIKEMKGKSNDVEVAFDGEEVNYTFTIDSLDYITHIGYIELKEKSNYLRFHSTVSGELGCFNLSPNSYVDIVFPEEFKLDPQASSIPNGMAKFVDNNQRIRVYDLNALDYADDWRLAVKRIDIDKDIVDCKFSGEYTIRVVGYNTHGEEGKLTIAALNPLFLSEVQSLGGNRTMTISMLESHIEIEDIEASVDEIDFAFEKRTFQFPIVVDKLDLVKEIKFISLEKGRNEINLNILLDGSLKPFELADHSVVKITFPKSFVLDLEACDFGTLTYKKDENAIYVNRIEDIENCQLKLAIDRININQVIEDNKFDWTGEVSVTAINTLTGEEGKLYIAGIDKLLLTDVNQAIENKTVSFDVPATQLRIEEAVMVSNMLVADIEEHIEIPINEIISEPINRVDSIGFMNPVALTLMVSTKGLETVDAPINLNADIILPSVFVISSNDEKVTVTDEGLHIEASHLFKENRTLKFELLVNSLDFTALEKGYLILPETEDGKRKLQYDGKASIIGSVSIDNAQLSSSLLNTGVSLDIAFEMDEVVLKDFTGLYGGVIDKVTDSFELGIEDGFAELEKNGLTLSNTKPELMVSLYNTIGIPVEVDLSIIGRDKDGVAISGSTIAVNDLRIKPAQLNAQGFLVADTTRWLFTSNEKANVPGYEIVVVEKLDSLLNELPYSVDFALIPQIITKDVVHRVDLSQPLELGGHYSISVPFDLQFAQSIALDLGEEVDILRRDENKVILANPQLMVGIHNPIAEDLVFDLAVVGKDNKGQPISSASLVFDEPFVLAAGKRNADGTITPKVTRWLFAVSDSITKKGYETKLAPALSTLLNELPHNIDVALNAHFNTDLTTQIDYENDLELTCEYGVLIPLQFKDIHLNYADTISELKINIEETLAEMNLSITNISLAIDMDLKNTLPLGLTLNLVPLDASGHIISEIEIGSIVVPPGDGSDIGTGDMVGGVPVELSVKCASSSDLSALDKIAFSLDVDSGNGNNALSGMQGLQISNIVLQIMCDIEADLSK